MKKSNVLFEDSILRSRRKNIRSELLIKTVRNSIEIEMNEESWLLIAIELLSQSE